MGNVILPVVGQTVGLILGGPLGGMLGSMYAGSFAKSHRVRLPTAEGPRLSELRAQTSTYGNIIPRVYGNMRMAGNVIWSTDIKEVKHEHTVTQGGGGKFNRTPKLSQTTISYSYYITLAIAICQGPIDEIIRVWADSKCLTESILSSAKGKYNVHLGDETQGYDDIIAKYKPLGSFSAYRGIAYVVIEDFPLAEFGNRIPNFTFEVKRSIRFKPALEDKIKEIVLIPGSGEFVYSTEVVVKQEVAKTSNGIIIPCKGKKAVNMHNYEGRSNVLLALDNMLKTLPNLEWVSVVVTWFATSTNAKDCKIIPKVEFHGNTLIYPKPWSVAGMFRENVQEVLRFADNSVTYGGTPSDDSILELIAELKKRNLKVMLYPMIFVDQIFPETKPWRGRIKATSTKEISEWFNAKEGYNSFVTHYANLVKGKLDNKIDNQKEEGNQYSEYNNKVDAFVIGSELVGLTSFAEADKPWNYPAVNELITLATKVKAILGKEVKITYAADWSEYHHTEGGWYNLDSLWANENIDIVGIDSYFPLTEDLVQNQITEAKIKEAWEKGEGWDYYTTDDRTKKISFNGYDYAWKNVEHWWSNKHTNPDGKQTDWQPKMKPIWFTEMGFPSVDACSNQPNVFYDPSSKESCFPRKSKGNVDFGAQREALNASLDYLQTRCKTPGKEDLVSKSFIWCFDARPFSYWPDLETVWQDARFWATGHWVNGKLGNSSLGAIVAELFELTGLKQSDFDVSRLVDIVEGYIIKEPTTVRAALEQLQAAYFFDVIESDGILKCVPRNNAAKHDFTEIKHDFLVTTEKNGIATTLEITRAQELELPKEVNLTYIDRPFNYDAVTQKAIRQTTKAIEQVHIGLPIVMSASLAQRIADFTLYNTWKERLSYQLILPPQYAKLEPTDVITVNIPKEDGLSKDDSHEHKLTQSSYQMRIIKTDLERNGLMKVTAVAEDINSYEFGVKAGTNTTKAKSKLKAGELLADTIIEILDLPIIRTSSLKLESVYVAAAPNNDNWLGASLYMVDSINNTIITNTTNLDTKTDSTNTDKAPDIKDYKHIADITNKATLGYIITDLGKGSAVSFDESNFVEVVLLSGSLYSITEQEILNGANLAMIGNEIIQFQNAELIGESKYRLSRFLRGRFGTEEEIKQHQAGSRFILIDANLHSISMNLNSIGKRVYFKPVTVGEHLCASSDSHTNEKINQTIEFNYQANYLKPLSPVHVTCNRDKEGNLIISWIRRARLENDWRDFVDVARDEREEKYVVEILEDRESRINGEIVKANEIVRKIETSSSSAIYTAAQQEIDFKTIPKRITVKICQLSDQVGPGFKTTISL